MAKYLAIICCLLGGCKIPNSNTYVEGTVVELGVYLPVDGSIYGLQVLRYVSGVVIKSTNDQMRITHHTTATNQYLGAVELQETKHTTIK